MKNSQNEIGQNSVNKARSEKYLSNNENDGAQPYSIKNEINSLHRVKVQFDWIRYKMAIS